MRITVNNIDISSKITSRKIVSIIDEDAPLLGNAVSKQLLIDVDNEDGFFDDLLDYEFILTESNQNGVFFVYDKPEKYTKQLSLKLYDNMYLFSQRYDTKQSYPTTIENQLDEMSGIADVDIDKSTIPIDVLTKEVNWYDNTISMRNYLGWIAELCGMNAFADHQGVIVFRALAEKTYSTIDVEDYSKNEKVKISRVCFDDGLVKYERGTTGGNTLYLSSNNSYVNGQDIIDFIYDKYNGLEFYSIDNVKMASIDGLEVTDLINYDDEFLFMPLSIDDTYKGGTYSILTVSGNIDTKNKESVINRIDNSVRIRRIQTIVDQNNQSLQIIAEKQENQDKQMSQIQLDLNGIKQIVEDSTTEIEEISKSLYTLNILGEGNVIKNANDTITLKASLFYKGEDVTDKNEASLFDWIRKSGNPAADTEWNNAHKGMKSIIIGSDDVNKYASFSLECNILADVIVANYMTIIDKTDIPDLSLSLDADKPLQQIESSEGLWPQWNPLIITPDIKNGVLQVMLNDSELTVSFKRIVDGIESDLLDGVETVENNYLKVNDNVLTSSVNRSIIYRCIVTYKGVSIIHHIGFSLIKDGVQGENGENAISYRIESSNGFLFDDESETTVTARIYSGSTEIDTEGNLNYIWYAKKKNETEFNQIASGKSAVIRLTEDMQLFFESEEGVTYLVNENEKYLIDETLRYITL